MTTNREMDQAMEHVMAEEESALANANNNAPGYVASRFVTMHLTNGYRVPIREGALGDEQGPLAPPSKQSSRANSFAVNAGPFGRGIVAPLQNMLTGEISDYLIEIDGNNGVYVTGKV